jgi:hypothetical protein
MDMKKTNQQNYKENDTIRSFTSHTLHQVMLNREHVPNT